MLYIYTRTFLDGFTLINDVEAGFKQLKYYGELFDDEISRKIMKLIDGVSFKDGDYIKTPFGTTNLDNLSTGCKAVLLAYYYRNEKNTLVNVIECGDNAILVLFQLAKKLDLRVFTYSYIKILDNKAECFINNIKTVSGLNIYGGLRALNE